MARVCVGLRGFRPCAIAFLCVWCTHGVCWSGRVGFIIYVTHCVRIMWRVAARARAVAIFIYVFYVPYVHIHIACLVCLFAWLSFRERTLVYYFKSSFMLHVTYTVVHIYIRAAVCCGLGVLRSLKSLFRFYFEGVANQHECMCVWRVCCPHDFFYTCYKKGSCARRRVDCFACVCRSCVVHTVRAYVWRMCCSVYVWFSCHTRHMLCTCGVCCSTRMRVLIFACAICTTCARAVCV